MDNSDLQFYHTNPELVYELNTQEHLADFKVSQFYINNTDQDVSVISRNNLPITVKRESGGYSISGSGKYFTIRTSYQFNSNERIKLTINSIDAVNKSFPGQKDDLEIIRKALLEAYNSNPNCRSTIVNIEYKVAIDKLKHSKILYVPSLDLLLSTNVSVFNNPHPFSSEGYTLGYYKDLVSEEKVSGVFVELIDNENNHSSRFMYLGKNLLELQSHVNKNKKSGVYVSTIENSRLNDISLELKYLTVEEAEDKIGLCKTKEEAISGGDPSIIIKQLEKEREAELLSLKHDNELAKAEIKTKELELENIVTANKLEFTSIENEYKRTIFELEKSVEELKKNNLIIKEKVEREKVSRDDEYDYRKKTREDYYDSRSYERKDTFEAIKYVPGIILGIIGAVTYVNSKSK